MDRRRRYSSGLQNPCVDIDMNTVLFILGGTDVQRGSRWERRCACSIRDYIGNLVPTAHGSEEDKNQKDAKTFGKSVAAAEVKTWVGDESCDTVCESVCFFFLCVFVFVQLKVFARKATPEEGGAEVGWGGAWRRERSKKQKTHQKREE